jgi:hypothetical protein
MAEAGGSRAEKLGLSPEAEARAETRIEEAIKLDLPLLMDVAEDRVHLGWHPAIGRLTVLRKGPGTPAHLPAYMAILDEAQHVHAGGETPDQAMGALVDLFTDTAKALSERDAAE